MMKQTGKTIFTVLAAALLCLSLASCKSPLAAAMDREAALQKGEEIGID